MIDRYYRQSEPDLDAYEPKPVDAQDEIDVPDFTEPDPGAHHLVDRIERIYTDPHLEFLDPPIDPAEQAAHTLIDALTTLEQQIVLAPSMERLIVLKALTKRAFDHANLVDGKASAAMDTILERLR